MPPRIKGDTVSKIQRQEKAKDMRGNSAQLLEVRQAIVLPAGFETMNSDDADRAMHEALNGSPQRVLIETASENEGIRNQQDVRKWMEDNEFVGTVYAFRRHNWGRERDGRYTRQAQTTFTIV